MTSLISLAMAYRSGMECSNWKQLSSLQSLRDLAVARIGPRSRHDFITMVSSLSSSVIETRLLCNIDYPIRICMAIIIREYYIQWNRRSMRIDSSNGKR
jgi:hypothetical protein